MGKSNRLLSASSPYLLQHAFNPVNWMEWGEEALGLARAEDKPILVSIGYSACHWCHVMERESFEDKDLADLMNEHFVCIKVDREERPDIDHLYMDAVQAMGVNGGWPLNVFLTPDQVPFYAGTYFRPQQWAQVLSGLARAFRTRREEVESSATDLRKFLEDMPLFPQARPSVEHSLCETMFVNIAGQFDPLHGGLDKAPRFPMPSIWQFLLRDGRPQALEMVSHTLNKMACGGIYDQVGGGFARYSVDGRWFVPHFEKMLYDNGQLMELYAEAFMRTQSSLFEETFSQTAEWLLREMTHPDGGFYSALDADSEGVEGKFYCWTTRELGEAIGDRAGSFIEYFSCTDEGNWEHGLNILTGRPMDNRPADWRPVVKQLLNFRMNRIRPGLDDKIITAWNGMAICGLVKMHLATGRLEWLQAAEQAFRFLRRTLTDGKKVFRSFRDRPPVTEGFLDDYAWYVRSALALYDVTFINMFLVEAEDKLMYVMDAFPDQSSPLFHYTSRHAPSLMARTREGFDNVTPSSNAVLASVLNRAGCLFDRPEWTDRARLMVNYVAGPMADSSAYMCGWGQARQEIDHGLDTVVIAATDPVSLRMAFGRDFLPFTLFAASDGEDSPQIPLLDGKIMINDRVTFYVCRGNTCKVPVHSPEEVKIQLNPGSIPA